MSQYAKSVIAAFAAVVFAGITAWQQIVGGGPFRPVDIIPLAVVIVGAVNTAVVPNVPELPWAKTVVHGSAAVLSALATVVAADPSGVTASKLLTVAASSLLVWFVPEFGGPALAPAGPDGVPDITDALRSLDQPTPAVSVKDPTTGMPRPVGPPTTEIPVQTPRPATPAVLAAEPTPIADAALAAATTGSLPAIPPANPNMAG